MKHILQLTLILFAVFFLSSCGYNKIVELEEKANQQWGQVESVYKRRAELLPQLMAQAKTIGNITDKYSSQLQAAQEKTLLKISNDDLVNTNKVQDYVNAQEELGQLMSQYLQDLQGQPDFELYEKNILDLKAQIEGSQNRINVEKRKYFKAVSEYNSYINKVPQNLTSGMMGFDEKAYLEPQ